MYEKNFIERLRTGEEDAFRELVETWQDRVYNTCIGLLQQEEDAQDCTQEVFITAYRKIDRFREEAAVGTWLYRIAVNRSLDLLRKRNRGKPAGEWIDFQHPGVQLEKKQGAAILFRAIRQLPENQKVAYQLQQMENLSQREIAAVMELSESAVEGLLQRARGTLRKILADYLEKNK
ncbi:MAG: sigma-70 family RNA polymerase sigma factor [Flavihumibacter sp.]